jgi:hypothetical protein
MTELMYLLSVKIPGARRSAFHAHGWAVEPPVVAPSLPGIERLESHLPAVSAGGEALPPGHDRYPGGRPRSARALLDPPAPPSRPERGSRGDRSRAALSHVADRPIPTNLTVALEHPVARAHAGVRAPRPARAGGAHAAALRGGLRRGRGDAGPSPPRGPSRCGGARSGAGRASPGGFRARRWRSATRRGPGWTTLHSVVPKERIG